MLYTCAGSAQKHFSLNRYLLLGVLTFWCCFTSVASVAGLKEERDKLGTLRTEYSVLEKSLKPMGKDAQYYRDKIKDVQEDIKARNKQLAEAQQKLEEARKTNRNNPTPENAALLKKADFAFKLADRGVKNREKKIERYHRKEQEAVAEKKTGRKNLNKLSRQIKKQKTVIAKLERAEKKAADENASKELAAAKAAADAKSAAVAKAKAEADAKAKAAAAAKVKLAAEAKAKAAAVAKAKAEADAKAKAAAAEKAKLAAEAKAKAAAVAKAKSEAEAKAKAAAVAKAKAEAEAKAKAAAVAKAKAESEAKAKAAAVAKAKAEAEAKAKAAAVAKAKSEAEAKAKAAAVAKAKSEAEAKAKAAAVAKAKAEAEAKAKAAAVAKAKAEAEAKAKAAAVAKAKVEAEAKEAEAKQEAEAKAIKAAAIEKAILEAEETVKAEVTAGLEKSVSEESEKPKVETESVVDERAKAIVESTSPSVQTSNEQASGSVSEPSAGEQTTNEIAKPQQPVLKKRPVRLPMINPATGFPRNPSPDIEAGADAGDNGETGSVAEATESADLEAKKKEDAQSNLTVSERQVALIIKNSQKSQAMSEASKKAREDMRRAGLAEEARLKKLLNSRDLGVPPFDDDIELQGSHLAFSEEERVFEFLGKNQYRIETTVSAGQQEFKVDSHRWKKIIPDEDDGKVYVFILDAKSMDRPRLTIYRKDIL